jgi:hypothetical protein
VAGWGLHKLISRHESAVAAAIAACYLVALASNVRDMAWVMFFVIAVALGSIKVNNPKEIKEES